MKIKDLKNIIPDDENIVIMCEEGPDTLAYLSSLFGDCFDKDEEYDLSECEVTALKGGEEFLDEWHPNDGSWPVIEIWVKEVKN